MEILTLLSQRLKAQLGLGKRYFVGDRLSGADLWWAAFCAMVEPLPPQDCPMNDFMRQAYTMRTPDLRKACDPVLLEHRDFVYHEHLSLPLDF